MLLYSLKSIRPNGPRSCNGE